MTVLQESSEVRLLRQEDIPELVQAFNELGWNKSFSLFEGYLQDQENGERIVWVAIKENSLAGYVTLKWKSYYPPFKNEVMPEIVDLNVLPPFRKQGIGSKLLDEAERSAFERSSIVGIGVGLYPDYGSAQRLYIKRGYIPDGNGVTYQYQPVHPGEKVCLDDDLILWFTKSTT